METTDATEPSERGDDLLAPCPILVGMFNDPASDTRSPAPRPASPARRAALYGVMAALALVAGYVEMLVPLPVAVPGVKLGLGNAIVLFALERLDARGAFALMLVKVAGSAILFGNPQVFAFSLAGGVLSWAVMALAVRSRAFSVVAVSVLGGISHDAGQLAMVALLLTPQVALASAPVLAVAGTVCGLVVGILVRALLRAIPREALHA